MSALFMDIGRQSEGEIANFSDDQIDDIERRNLEAAKQMVNGRTHQMRTGANMPWRASPLGRHENFDEALVQWCIDRRRGSRAVHW